MIEDPRMGGQTRKAPGADLPVWDPVGPSSPEFAVVASAGPSTIPIHMLEQVTSPQQRREALIVRKRVRLFDLVRTVSS